MKNQIEERSIPRAVFIMLVIITLILVGTVLKLGTPFVLPLVISILLTFVLEPLVSRLEAWKLPRLVAILLLLIVFAGLVYIIGLVMFSSIRTIASVYPKYEAKFTEVYLYLAQLMSLPYDSSQSLLDNLWNLPDLRHQVQVIALQVSNGFVKFLSSFMMLSLFVFMLLLELGQIRKRIDLALEGAFSGDMNSIASDIVRHVARYLSVKFFISLATGILVWLGLSVIGLDFPVLWGVISFVLNFIPTIGSIVASLGAIFFALVQFWPDPLNIVLVFSVMLSVNFILGNILEPRVMGENLGLSPFVILMSLLAWGWLWGFTGLVLAVPMTVIVKIICEHIPMLEPVSIVMGSYKSALERNEKKQDKQN